jgi:hypothetical protein
MLRFRLQENPGLPVKGVKGTENLPLIGFLPLEAVPLIEVRLYNIIKEHSFPGFPADTIPKHRLKSECRFWRV